MWALRNNASLSHSYFVRLGVWHGLELRIDTRKICVQIPERRRYWSLGSNLVNIGDLEHLSDTSEEEVCILEETLKYTR
jgi:hypothetical protein